MPEVKPYVAGDFCWVDVASPNIESSKSFYQAILGWNSITQAMDDGKDYTFFSLGNSEVGGGYTLTQEIQAEHIPPHWSSYIMVDNADECVQKAESLGATILQPVINVMDVGRMAVIKDPTDAVFSIWQTKKDDNTAPLSKSTPGMYAWFELATHDTEKAKDFYTRLFGWETKTEAIPGGGDYTDFSNKGVSVAGMLAITDRMPNMPASWSIYFAVDHFDTVADKAIKQGAELAYEPKDVPNVGRFAMLKDPQGIYFSMIQLAEK